MGFELYYPTSARTQLASGTATLTVPGMLRVSMFDLNRIRVNTATENKVTLLLDRSLKRLAIRKARDGEPSVTLKVNKSRTTAVFNVAPMLKQLGLDVAKVKGPRELQFVDDLLTLNLGK
jgi:hypothetical protein